MPAGRKLQMIVTTNRMAYQILRSAWYFSNRLTSNSPTKNPRGILAIVTPSHVTGVPNLIQSVPSSAKATSFKK